MVERQSRHTHSGISILDEASPRGSPKAADYLDKSMRGGMHHARTSIQDVDANVLVESEPLAVASKTPNLEQLR